MPGRLRFVPVGVAVGFVAFFGYWLLAGIPNPGGPFGVWKGWFRYIVHGGLAEPWVVWVGVAAVGMRARVVVPIVAAVSVIWGLTAVGMGTGGHIPWSRPRFDLTMTLEVLGYLASTLAICWAGWRLGWKLESWEDVQRLWNPSYKRPVWKRRRVRRASGFTLIEVLVVVAILAVLAALLFPVLARAKAASLRASCTSNMHQVLIAIRLYADENDEGVARELGTMKSGADASVFWCPADRFVAEGGIKDVLIPGPPAAGSSYYYLFSGKMSPYATESGSFTFETDASKYPVMIACINHSSPPPGPDDPGVHGVILQGWRDGHVSALPSDWNGFDTDELFDYSGG